MTDRISLAHRQNVIENFHLNECKYKELVKLFGGDKLDKYAVDALIFSVRSVIDEYLMFYKSGDENGDFERHRRRLSSIESASHKLQNFLKEEPLFDVLLTHSDEFLSDMDTLDGKNRRKLFLRELRFIHRKAAELVDDPEHLRSVRFDRPPKDRQKSPETLYLWEPLFRNWSRSGVPMGRTRKGTIYKFVALLHGWLGLPPPHEETLYKALRGFLQGNAPSNK